MHKIVAESKKVSPNANFWGPTKVLYLGVVSGLKQAYLAN
jgi:hypothetical protein